MNFIWEMKSKLWNVNLIAGGKQIKYQIAGLTLDSADEQPAPFSLPVVAAWSPPPRDQATSRWAGPGQPTTCPAAPWTRTCTGHCHTSPTYRGDLETDQGRNLSTLPLSVNSVTPVYLWWLLYWGCVDVSRLNCALWLRQSSHHHQSAHQCTGHHHHTSRTSVQCPLYCQCHSRPITHHHHH